MKAVRVNQFGTPEELKVENVPDPEPGPGQIVVKVRAAGVNPVDCYIRNGTYKIKPALPYTPGIDGAGVVEKSGEGARKFKPGDSVYIAGSVTGTYAEKAVCNENQVYSLPGGFSWNDGASIGVPYATAYRALFQKAKAKPGELLLVHGGSGGVGLAAVQIARMIGMTVIATAGTERGRALVKNQGAHIVFDHHSPHYLDKIAQVAGRGPDVILEMLANANLQKDLETLAPRGRVIIIGCRGEIQINPRLMMAKEASVLGMTLFNASEEDLAVVHAGLAAGFENGFLKPVIGTELPLSEAVKAHHQILEEPALGKIILRP